MRSYYKHTDGEAFTLDGSDYVGFFHISDDGNAYTGKIDSSTMDELTPKNTFISKFYQNKGDFDTVYKHVEGIVPYFSNTNDIINLQGLTTALSHLDDNNLICFKNLILKHPTVYQLEDNGVFYYGLSSTTDNLTGKNDDLDIYTFSSSDEWGFLDSISTGDFTVSLQEDFKYFCSNGISLFVVGGSFVDPKELELIVREDLHTFPPTNGETDYIHSIYSDEDANQLFLVKNDFIDILDTRNFNDCNTLLIIDRIPLGELSVTIDYIWGVTELPLDQAFTTFDNPYTIDNPNNPQYVKVGNNLRTSFKEGVLYLYNKFSDDLITTYDLRSYDIVELCSIDIRNTDDNVLIVYKNGNNALKMLFIEPETEEIQDNFLYSINESGKYTVKFSNIDSDTFNLYTPTEYQTRFFSAPEYPAGRLETGVFNYPTNYKWEDPHIPFNLFNFRFGYASELSNYYNNLTAPEVIRNDKMYMLLHNVGRLFAVHQPSNDRFLNALPLNINSRYNDPTCSQSSMGLYFNSAISLLIRDIVNLFSDSYGSFNIEEREVHIQKLNDLTQSSNNLYLNGNETFNIISFQRIFLLINELQSSLLSKSIEN